MKIKLNESLHFSELGRDAIPAGETVDIPDTQAKSLIERGLASGVAAPQAAAKKARAARNKSAPPVSNKRR